MAISRITFKFYVILIQKLRGCMALINYVILECKTGREQIQFPNRFMATLERWQHEYSWYLSRKQIEKTNLMRHRNIALMNVNFFNSGLRPAMALLLSRSNAPMSWLSESPAIRIFVLYTVFPGRKLFDWWLMNCDRAENSNLFGILCAISVWIVIQLWPKY